MQIYNKFKYFFLMNFKFLFWWDSNRGRFQILGLRLVRACVGICLASIKRY